MPESFKRMAPVQFFTWMGLFLMWFYLTTTIAKYVFEAPNPQSELYADGVAWANICFGFYSIITFIYALIVPSLTRKIGITKVHAMSLLLGGLGLISIYFVHDPWLLLIPMTGVGIAWTSIVSMPYVIIANDIPPKHMGMFMGLFNMFIVIPEIIAALFFGYVMKNFLGNQEIYAVMLGGTLLIFAAILTLIFVKEPKEQ